MRGKVYVKNSTMLTRLVSIAKFELYTLEGGGSMTEAAILERRSSVELSEKLNGKAQQEIEALLEQSEQSPTKKKTVNGGWYFRMAGAGVKYYSF